MTTRTIDGVLLNGLPLEVEEPGLGDHGCLCRRCLLHDDPGGCLVVAERHRAVCPEGDECRQFPCPRLVA